MVGGETLLITLTSGILGCGHRINNNKISLHIDFARLRLRQEKYRPVCFTIILYYNIVPKLTTDYLVTFLK